MALRIKYAFLTTEADEPEAINNFIAGYELAGGDWNGTIDIDNNIGGSDFTQAYVDEQINNGYDMLLRNTAVNLGQSNVLSDSIKRGMLPVVPVASNYYHAVGTTTSAGLFSAVFCGSGLREQGNATAYPCIFFDVAPSEEPTEIREVRQCGAEYTVSHIQRVSSSTLYIKLSGISDITAIGIIEQGIPLYISTAITGTDISPLPTGVIYTSNIIFDNGYFQVSHTTSAGTTGTFQTVTTGKLKYGITSSTETTSRVLIIRDGYNVDTAGMGITIKGVTGFDINPNGVIRVAEYINNDGYGNKIKIVTNLGTGTYDGNGSMLFATESYSTPFIAGQLAYIKDSTGFDWYDVIGNAIVTSSNYPDFDTYSGYGYLQIDKAIDPLIDKDLTAPVLELEEQVTGAITFSWNFIPYAKEYEIWFRGELIVTLNAHIKRYSLSPGAFGFYPNISSSKRNLIKVRAKNGDTYSEFSNEIEYLFYYATGILYKNYA
jgi:hypothetical protein